jgi:hypothetical protein
MTVEYQDPEAHGIGYNKGEPVADSVDDYSDYPDTYEDSLTWEYRDVVREAFKTVGGSHPWLHKELGVDPSGSFAARSKEHDFELEAPEDSQFHVTLEAHTTENDRAMDWPEHTQHVEQIGDPLQNGRWLKSAVQRDYGPEEISDLFGWIEADEVKERLLSLGLIEETEIQVGDETIDLSDYHARPWQDPRLLEKCDAAGMTLAETAETLGCTTKAVTEQARAYQLTE